MDILISDISANDNRQESDQTQDDLMGELTTEIQNKILTPTEAESLMEEYLLQHGKQANWSKKKPDHVLHGIPISLDAHPIQISKRQWKHFFNIQSLCDLEQWFLTILSSISLKEVRNRDNKTGGDFIRVISATCCCINPAISSRLVR